MPSLITKAGAWANGEVAYLAWSVEKAIPGCLGFMITRVHDTGPDAGQRRILPTWIAFTDQSNPEWLAQDSSVWPVQSFEWRDLTLRRSRDTTNVRPIDFRVHYEIVPVGLEGPGRTPVPPSSTAPYKDDNGHERYTGKPRALYVIGDPTRTLPIDVTHEYGPGAAIEATFTNGILSTQNLLQQLQSAKLHAKPGAVVQMPTTTKGLLTVLQEQIVDQKSAIRAFLTADALSFVRRLVDLALSEGGEVYLALYELHDPELISLLKTAANQSKVHIILSTAGSERVKGKGQVWDTENYPVRQSLHRIKPDPVQDRMFNNSTAIGHDKFAVYVKDGAAQIVMTGSTNWTETGLCTQSNNAVILNDPATAQIYLDFWHRLQADQQPKPVPMKITSGKTNYVGSVPNNANQSKAQRDSNMRAYGPTKPGGSIVDIWFSPNTSTNKKTADSPMPGDLNDVYSLMDHAKQAIFFLTFMPGESGKQNIIGEAAKLATERPELLVLGAISDPRALPNFVPPKKGAPRSKVKIPPPSIWWPAGDQSRIAMIRATAITTPVGDLHPELLSAGHAIIHDKIIVIDPLDPINCAVITGSHNLGYKASYDNDENLLIIRGNAALATAYAVHVLDIYQHYLMRAKQEDQIRTAIVAGKKPSAPKTGQGFLSTTDAWQSRFFARSPSNAHDYFLQIQGQAHTAPGVAVGLGSRSSVTTSTTAPRRRKGSASKSVRRSLR
jgi:phosphatidylserine/phosphatidylglycerophosphate/cardiolipin synthase-like enzyme